MPNYFRLYRPGGTWFFTVNLQNRRSRLLTDHIALLDAAVAKTRSRWPFDINAWVVLPDHLHAIWNLPPGDSDFSTRWRLVKTHFTKALAPTEWRSQVQQARAERGIWQRRYWEHLIRSETDYERHITYCYFNPVKHGLVEHPQDWPHSTIHRDISGGFEPADWTAAKAIEGDFGER